MHQALIEFADVFAINDLDIGKFRALVDYIKLGQALPIKQSMRRTPLGFGTQEQATLERMLEAGVIEPSQSEWATPHSRLIPMYNARFILWPPSLSSPIRKKLLNSQTPKMKSRPLEQSSCLKTQAQLENRSFLSTQYDAKNSKKLPICPDSALL